MVAAKYRTIIGKNRYSKNRRKFCYKDYEDGRHYSDCSSSVALTYKECGFPFPGNAIPTTEGIYKSKYFTDVPVVIEKGIILNPEVLRVGDMLLFAGHDENRAGAGYVGHVEMVYSINDDGSVTICGHGQGNPSLKVMNLYCRTRYKLHTKTKLGNRGLIKVRRFIQDDGSEPAGSSNGHSPDGVLRMGDISVDVIKLQRSLFALGYMDNDAVDGKFGEATRDALEKFQFENGVDNDGEYGKESAKAMELALTALMKNAGVLGTATANGKMNIRSENNRKSDIIARIKFGTLLNVVEIYKNGWYKVQWDGGYGYVSNTTGGFFDYHPLETHAGRYVAVCETEIRAGTGAKAAVVATLPKGRSFICDGQYQLVKKTEWLHGEFNGKAGYVSSRNLRKR